MAAGLLFALQLVPALLFFDLPSGPFLAFAEQLHRCAMRRGQRPRLVYGRKRVLWKVLCEERPDLFGAHFLIVDQLGQAVHMAVAIDQHVIPVAGGKDVTHVLQRANEGARRIAPRPRCRHLSLALLQR